MTPQWPSGKASVLSEEDPGIVLRFLWSCCTIDLETGTVVATLLVSY